MFASPRARLTLLAAALLLQGCGQPAGQVCEITGSGFHARDPCAHKCLSRWAVNCPDGKRVTPKVCTGPANCAPGSCGDGLLCYSFDDPFEERSYCIPESVCGPLSDREQLRWERGSAEAAQGMREKYKARSNPGKHGGATTTPGADGQ